jgi:hypothetical protein
MSLFMVIFFYPQSQEVVVFVECLFPAQSGLRQKKVDAPIERLRMSAKLDAQSR